jgi:hypothetical protein
MTNTPIARIGCLTLRKLTPTEQEICQAAARRKCSTELYEPFEDWIYSLIAASAVVAVLLGILSMLDSPATRTGAASTERPLVIEKAGPSQGKDGKF